jgi:hypothetical protein
MKSWRTHPAVSGAEPQSAALEPQPRAAEEPPVEREIPYSKPKPARAKVRPCLRCRSDFRSDGFHNRLCSNCRRADSPLIPR